ncbi:TetR/AcrR family transcriptional regulator [Verrucomicrobiaceae bacterium R5-34]|uniref:TetR/AcrR family transcriptional regulator n=2 Tax=Oceaniferula flava TaxID=2800421 RepID=A0AAE2V799_9BACT|nr:TetR/AcrR family transcriptional regulator [Verrucomicrobiaceae bacterium R5-34]MBK1853332.1 TetR/AcrR family transcriptional regulator [Oceaniferula flavus]MBM1134637.1 TetR/AcrR family transcriptional regulator [Oceaniferula flavus]
MNLTLSQKKRAAIVQAAIKEFQISGYNCSNMDSIASRAKVSKRTVYNHFESKEALFQEISKQLCDSVTNVVPEPFDPAITLREQLLDFAKKKIELSMSPKFIALCKVILPERVRNPGLSAETFQRIRCDANGFELWLADAAQAGAIKTIAIQTLSRQFSGLLMEFVFWPQFFGIESPPTKKELLQIAESTVDLFLNGCES